MTYYEVSLSAPLKPLWLDAKLWALDRMGIEAGDLDWRWPPREVRKTA